MEGENLLGINQLKAYLNSRTFDDRAIVTLFDNSEGIRHDLFLSSLDDELLNDELILDIYVEL